MTEKVKYEIEEGKGELVISSKGYYIYHKFFESEENIQAAEQLRQLKRR